MKYDQEIIQLLRSGKNKTAFEKIYAHFPSIKKLIITHGGTEEEAKDIFQESVIIFYEKATQSDFVLSSSIATFLYAICDRLWLKKLRDVKAKETTLGALSPSKKLSFEIDEQNDFDLDNEQNIKILDQLLDNLGNPCKTLLTNYYYLKMSMKEIAQNMEYSSENIAKNQKYKCLERAKKMVKEKLSFFKARIFSYQ
jgi:RNA polymerase sigma factor (sigma-70 family)